MEWLAQFLSTASYLQVFTRLAQMSASEVVIIFLVSKPVFVMMAIGAVITGSGRAVTPQLDRPYDGPPRRLPK